MTRRIDTLVAGGDNGGRMGVGERPGAKMRNTLIAFLPFVVACGEGTVQGPRLDAAEGIEVADDALVTDVWGDWDVRAADEAEGGLEVEAGDGLACETDEDCVGKVPGLASCEVARCLLGQCVARPADDGEQCDDGNACTSETQCVNGVCKGSLVNCNDDNVCTMDTCDPEKGCVYTPKTGTKCDDGSTCTTKDKCNAEGKCMGNPVDCEDGDPCTDDSCVEGQGCIYVLNTAPCDDLNDCTGPDQCSEGVCVGAPIVCDSPPHNECKDAYTMISYYRQGVCQEGGRCFYPSQEVFCVEGCEGGLCIGDPCAGVDCSTPPGQCFVAPGQCILGQCSFEFDNGKACDDGNACTGEDTCMSGVCAGTPIVCNTPPPNSCADARRVRTYERFGICEPVGGCRYEPRLLPCVGGCVGGVCVETLELLQMDLNSGGLGGMASGPWEGACLMPGWAGGRVMSNNVWRLTVGFEP